MAGSDFFPSTQWSLLRQAQSGGAQGEQALVKLLQQYLPALGAYLTQVRRLSADAADDLLQAFVTERVLQQQLMARASQARGKFRTLLLTSLEHFLVSRVRYNHAQCRDARRAVDIAQVGAVAAPGPEPARAFDIAWARALVSQAVRQMEAQCQANGRLDVWKIFEARLLRESVGEPTPSYEELTRELGLRSPMQAANLLVTAKRMYSNVLRRLVAEYEPDEAGIDAEIAELRALLASDR